MTRALRRRAALPAILALALLHPACAPEVEPDQLLDSLASNDLEVRQDAADKVQQLIERGDYDVFVRGIRSTNLLHRAQSLVFLARFSAPAAREALRGELALGRRVMVPFNPIKLKPTTEKEDSRILVANLIHGSGGDPEAVGVLLKGVDQDQPPETLVGTCFAVGALRDPRGIPFLAQAAGSADTEVVRAAAQAASQFKEPEAFAILERLSTHPSEQVRADVLSALTSRDDDASRRLVLAMGKDDPSPDLRASVYRALSRADPATMVPYLIARLKEHPPEPAKSAVVEVLEQETGQSLGARPEAWSRWWSRHKAVATSR